MVHKAASLEFTSDMHDDGVQCSSVGWFVCISTSATLLTVYCRVRWYQWYNTESWGDKVFCTDSAPVLFAPQKSLFRSDLDLTAKFWWSAPRQSSRSPDHDYETSVDQFHDDSHGRQFIRHVGETVCPAISPTLINFWKCWICHVAGESSALVMGKQSSTRMS